MSTGPDPKRGKLPDSGKGTGPEKRARAFDLDASDRLTRRTPNGPSNARLDPASGRRTFARGLSIEPSIFGNTRNPHFEKWK